MHGRSGIREEREVSASTDLARQKTDSHEWYLPEAQGVAAAVLEGARGCPHVARTIVDLATRSVLLRPEALTAAPEDSASDP